MERNPGEQVGSGDSLAEQEAESFRGGSFVPKTSFLPSSKAKKEAAVIADNSDYEKDGVEKEHGRHQRFQDHANMVALGLLWTVAILTLVGMGVYIFHIVAPKSWLWLEPDSLDKVRALLTGVLFSSAMSGYMNKRMSHQNSP